MILKVVWRVLMGVLRVLMGVLRVFGGCCRVFEVCLKGVWKNKIEVWNPSDPPTPVYKIVSQKICFSQMTAFLSLPYFATCGLVCFLAVTQCAWVPLVCVRLFCHWQCCASASGRVTLLPHTLAYINFFLILWPLTCNTIIHLAIHWSFLYNNNISVTRVSEGMRGGCFTT